MWEPLQRYRALDEDSQRLFRRAAILLPWIRVSLRIRGYNPTLVRLQQRSSEIPAVLSIANEPVSKTYRMIHAFGTSCENRALPRNYGSACGRRTEKWKRMPGWNTAEKR